MAFVRNMKKTSRVVGALKQIKLGFLPKPEIRTLFCRNTNLIFGNYRGNKPLHPKYPNSILSVQAQPITSHYGLVNYTRTAQFHHLAENALLAWATSMSNRNPDLSLKFSGLESVSGMRNYAKDVDSKQSTPIEEKKNPTPMKVDECDSAARFAEAKRILKEKRMAKGLDNPKRSPFEEP